MIKALIVKEKNRMADNNVVENNAAVNEVPVNEVPVNSVNEEKIKENRRILGDIATAVIMWRDAIGEQRNVESKRTTMVNILINNVDHIINVLRGYSEMEEKLKDANELVEVLENSLGEADDRIKALERASAKKRS